MRLTNGQAQIICRVMLMKVLHEHKQIDNVGNGVLIKIYDTEEVSFCVIKNNIETDDIFISHNGERIVVYG